VSGAESAVKAKLSSLPVVPAVRRFGATVIFPTPTRAAAPLVEAKTSTTRQAQSAVPLARVTIPPAIDPERVY
jgi:hypothetical protein